MQTTPIIARSSRRASGSFTLCLLVACASWTGMAWPAAAQDAQTMGPLAAREASVSREGEGARRNALGRKERTPFPLSAWDALSEWNAGKGKEQLEPGKPVLIITWTDYLPASSRATSVGKRLADRFADKGLIVVMAHFTQGWADATKPTGAKGNLLVALDAKGDFRKALESDSDPDFYVIDRAGLLRFADIATDSVEKAVELVVEESAQDAQSLTQRLRDEAQQRDRQARRTAAINDQATFTNIPELPFPDAAPAEYESATWPKRPLDEQRQQTSPGAMLPPVTGLRIPDAASWFPRPPQTKGRVLFVYGWHPAIPPSFDMMRAADTIQRRYGRDVAVIGLFSPAESFNNRQLTDDEKNPDKIRERFESFTRQKNFEHSIGFAPSVDIFTTTVTENPRPFPELLIISTDGICRWWTHTKNQMNYEAALDMTINNDPGVRNRRKVEEEWLRAQKAPAGRATPAQADPSAPR